MHQKQIKDKWRHFLCLWEFCIYKGFLLLQLDFLKLTTEPVSVNIYRLCQRDIYLLEQWGLLTRKSAKLKNDVSWTTGFLLALIWNELITYKYHCFMQLLFNTPLYSSPPFLFLFLSFFFKVCGFHFRRAHDPNRLIFTQNRSGTPSLSLTHTHICIHIYTQTHTPSHILRTDTLLHLIKVVEVCVGRWIWWKGWGSRKCFSVCGSGVVVHTLPFWIHRHHSHTPSWELSVFTLSCLTVLKLPPLPTLPVHTYNHPARSRETFIWAWR